MSISIRKMVAQDYCDALALWQRLPGLGLSTADEEEAVNDFLLKNPDTCFVAMDGHLLVGTVLGGSDGRRGYLYHLAVREDHQRSGLGRRLTKACLSALKSSGIKKCHIFVITDNSEGKIFWKTLGWQLRDDIQIMSKDL